MAHKPPEITLELEGGSLVIRSPEATYRIIVPQPAARPALAPGGDLPRALESGVESPSLDMGLGELAWDAMDTDLPMHDNSGAGDGFVAPSFQPTADEMGFYRDLSHDMYREVGRLAKQLSSSIREVRKPQQSAGEGGGIDLSEAGQRLEAAKDQLEYVVKMTEQATNRIFDLGEDIQAAASAAREIMSQITTGEGDAPDPERQKAQDILKGAVAALCAYLAQVGAEPLDEPLRLARELAEGLESAPAGGQPAPAAAPAPAPAPAAPAAPQGPWYQFPLDLVFQTIYELCTNETVKKHIKAMWESGEKDFNRPKVEADLNAASPGQPDQDNFLNLNLKEVLKSLFMATKNERFQQVLKKMAATADQIFLDQSLPLEAMPGQPPAQAAAPPPPPAPAPAPAPAAAPAGPDPALVAQAQALAQSLEALAQSLTPPELPDDLEQTAELACAGGENGNLVEPDLVQRLDQTMESIVGAVNSIIEALSFQDLSGQAIYKIVRLLSDFQVQLVATVVSFGTKLKTRETRQELSVEESEKLAQDEVDKVLAGIRREEEPRKEGESKEELGAELDQDAVNSLLEDLGF